MTWTLSILAVLAVLSCAMTGNGWPLLFAVALGITAIVHHENLPEVVAENAREDAAAAAQARAEATPHVVREADGCKVYAFKAGELWHYFTRCPNSSTTTEAYHKVTETHQCGKTQCSTTKLVPETITTETKGSAE